MKKLRLIIIILFVILLLVLLIRFIVNNRDEYGPNDGAGPDYIVMDYTPISEKNAAVFYTVEDCVQRYLDDTTLTEDFVTESQYENILDLLDENFKSKNNINQENIINYISFTNTYVNFIALKMEYADYSNGLQEYRVYGKICKKDTGEFIEYDYFKVTLDVNNMIFSIEPVKNCNNLEEVNLDDYEIEKEMKYNSHNSFSYVTVSDDDLMKYYFDYIKNALLNSPEEIYSILDENYRNTRFKSLNSFTDYIENHKGEIESIKLDSYETEDMVVNVVYTCKDNNNKKYIINQNAVMDFSLTLEY